jgi:hypothetical protein
MIRYNQGIINGENIPGDVIVVSIKDALSHLMLLQSITTALRLSMHSENKNDGDDFKLEMLVELLEAILPDEEQLKSGVGNVK